MGNEKHHLTEQEGNCLIYVSSFLGALVITIVLAIKLFN